MGDDRCGMLRGGSRINDGKADGIGRVEGWGYLFFHPVPPLSLPPPHPVSSHPFGVIVGVDSNEFLKLKGGS